MPAPSAAKAWSLVRDPSHFQWYVIPLLFVVAYVYANEVERRNWSAILAALTFWAWIGSTRSGAASSSISRIMRRRGARPASRPT